MNVSSNANLTRMAKMITDELGKMPSVPFHWSSWQDQHAMDKTYLMNVKEFRCVCGGGCVVMPISSTHSI